MGPSVWLQTKLVPPLPPEPEAVRVTRAPSVEVLGDPMATDNSGAWGTSGSDISDPDSPLEHDESDENKRNTAAGTRADPNWSTMLYPPGIR